MAYSPEYGYQNPQDFLAYNPVSGYDVPQQNYYQQPVYQQAGSSPLDAASDLYSAYEAGGLFGGGGNAALQGGAGQLTAPGALAPGAVETVPLGAPGASGFGGFSTGGSYSGLGGMGMMALPLALGAFNMPIGGMRQSKAINDARMQEKYESDVKPTLDAYNASVIPAGMSQEAYNASRQPPRTPSDLAQDNIWSSDEGDKSWQIDEAEAYNDSAAGRAEFEDWRQSGDNALWYNEDRTRTDYAGPYAPSLDVQRNSAAENFGAHNVRDPNSPVIGGTYNSSGTSNYGSSPISSYGTVSDPQQQQQPTQTTGNIYGQDVPRQTFGGKDLYADQKLFSGNKYKGY